MKRSLLLCVSSSPAYPFHPFNWIFSPRKVKNSSKFGLPLTFDSKNKNILNTNVNQSHNERNNKIYKLFSTVWKNFFFSCLSSLHINDSNFVTNDFIELVFLHNKTNSRTRSKNLKLIFVKRSKIQKLRVYLIFFILKEFINKLCVLTKLQLCLL